MNTGYNKLQLEITELHKKVFTGKICPYCGGKPEYVDSRVIYGQSFGMIYLCSKCDAYVGVHKGTDNPLGRLANKELRHWKKEAHLYFDKVWKLKIMTRGEAYTYLSGWLEVPRDYTHIGMFSIETCKQVVICAKQILNDNRRCDLDFGATPSTPYYEIN